MPALAARRIQHSCSGRKGGQPQDELSQVACLFFIAVSIQCHILSTECRAVPVAHRVAISSNKLAVPRCESFACSILDAASIFSVTELSGSRGAGRAPPANRS